MHTYSTADRPVLSFVNHHYHYHEYLSCITSCRADNKEDTVKEAETETDLLEELSQAIQVRTYLYDTATSNLLLLPTVSSC